MTEQLCRLREIDLRGIDVLILTLEKLQDRSRAMRDENALGSYAAGFWTGVLKQAEDDRNELLEIRRNLAAYVDHESIESNAGTP